MNDEQKGRESSVVFALIFAGGMGRRMKSGDIPKQFLKVDGRPIIIRTIEHFSRHKLVDQIVVVCLETWIGELKKEMERYDVRKVSGILAGGETGFQSIHRGLERVRETAADNDIVLICDGVRPMLTEQLITQCIVDAKEYGSAVPVTPSIDSVLYSEDGETCENNYDRKKVYITQAPQGYRMRLISEAHALATQQKKEAISSADLLIDLGMTVHLYPGIRENIKVTTAEDLNALRATQYYEHFKNFSREESAFMTGE